MPNSPQPLVNKKHNLERWGLGSLLFLTFVLLWGQIQHEVLHAVDAIVYAQIGKELSTRPFSQWCILTWHGLRFFENPPFMFWLVAGSIRILGETTFAAVFPAVCLSTLSVGVAYGIGKMLVDREFGLLYGLMLALTPSFIRNGRNPMLEPPLMFFTMVSLYFYLRSRRTPLRGFLWIALSGLAFSCAFLTKGPPALVSIGIIGVYALFARIFDSSEKPFDIRNALFSSVIFTIKALIPIVGFEMWYRAQTGISFFETYYAKQVFPSLVTGRNGAPSYDLFFYLRDFWKSDWPWMPLVILSPFIAAWSKNGPMRRAVFLGWLALIGIVGGFTMARQKAPWYLTIDTFALALVTAVSLSALLKREWVERGYVRFCLGLGVIVATVASTFPNLFIYPRYPEEFFEAASRHMPRGLRGKTVADCAHLDPYQGSFFLSYYLDLQRVNCDLPSALILTTNEDLEHFPSVKLIFARTPYVLIQRN